MQRPALGEGGRYKGRGLGTRAADGVEGRRPARALRRSRAGLRRWFPPGPRQSCGCDDRAVLAVVARLFLTEYAGPGLARVGRSEEIGTASARAWGATVLVTRFESVIRGS